MLAIVLIMTTLFGQADAYGQFTAPVKPSAQARKAAREKAIARTGEQARGMVDHYGEDAVAALMALKPETGRLLARFYHDGQMAKWPNPPALLTVLGRGDGADDACRWAVEHASELMDEDAFSAYLAEPLEYALGLKSLNDGAAQARAIRLGAEAGKATPRRNAVTAFLDEHALPLGIAFVTVAVVGVIWKKLKQKGQQNQTNFPIAPRP